MKNSQDHCESNYSIVFVLKLPTDKKNWPVRFEIEKNILIILSKLYFTVFVKIFR